MTHIVTFTFFHDEGPYGIETSPLICRANHYTGFYMVSTSVMKEVIASHFANCEVNSYYRDRNVSHSMKNAKRFFRFKINLINRYEE